MGDRGRGEEGSDVTITELHQYNEWWVIHADVLRQALYRVYDGEYPEAVWLDLVIEADVHDVTEGEEE